MQAPTAPPANPKTPHAEANTHTAFNTTTEVYTKPDIESKPNVNTKKTDFKTRTRPWLEKFGMFLAVVVPPCGALYAAVLLTRGHVFWGYPVLAFVLASLTNLGTTAGYHRMLTHQAFKAHPVVQYALLILGAVAGMSSPIVWAHDHIYHHSHSDTENDLHSPHTQRFQGWGVEVFWQWLHAHIGWLFCSTIPFNKATPATDTPAARFVHKTCYVWLLAGIFVPLCFGWNAFVWAGLVRLFLSHHITWSVNSICHLWGQQPFQGTKDKSKNNVLVGILALGEGWHNNHHFRPASAQHGMLPRQLDITYSVICLLERCKLVWQVKRYAPCPTCQTWQAADARKNVTCTQCRVTA